MAHHKKLFYLFPILFVSQILFSQQILPLYEKNENGDILLLRIDSIPKDVKNKFDTISVITAQGICYGKLSKFKLITHVTQFMVS